MKTYEVELCRTSYIIVTVEADNEDEAETKAWVEIKSHDGNMDSSWDVESIKEMSI
jgi:hypothetical protein